MAVDVAPNADAIEEVVDEVPLRYSARAGLLNEVSRQTYDVLYKALREAVLNGSDAGASTVHVDLSRIASDGSITVRDDGHGMTLEKFASDFMGIGGSAKFESDDQFGRIGIGSLALLQYASTAVVETKVRGSAVYTRATLKHVRDLTAEQRATGLDELDAGEAVLLPYSGSPDDQFTSICLRGVSDEITDLGANPARCYALIEQMRRVLPLPWADPRIKDALRESAPEVAAAIQSQVADWQSNVTVDTPWERDISLTWRAFGDDPGEAETWSGQISPFMKKIRVPGVEPQREICVAGYLLNQARPSTSWMGLTARVQNVAVEENTFFDVTADPGFRKYISGEVWIFGEIDRQRLINIDRASFNRESPDYKAAQRYLATEIVEFKSASVQRPQRKKASVRSLLDQRRKLIEGIAEVADLATLRHAADCLPSSEPGRRLPEPYRTLTDDLEEIGVNAGLAKDASDISYRLSIEENGSGVAVEISRQIAHPCIVIGSKSYDLIFSRGTPEGPPIVIRNRPRRIIVNLDHETHAGPDQPARVRIGMALELSYLMAADEGSSAMYERLLGLLA
jgi:hypothetical protein